MAFAVERGKQKAKHITREIVSRAAEPEHANSLLGQIKKMHLGFASASSTASSVITLERPEGNYVFSDMAADVDNNISGHVRIFDPSGQQTGDVIISRIAVLDDNRIDFEISSTTSTAAAASSESWSGTGSIVGLSGETNGMAMAFVAVDGEDTQTKLLNYGNLDLSGGQTAALPLVSSVAASTGGVASNATEDGETCGGGAVASVMAAVGICVAVVIIVVVVVICYVLLFWTFCY